MTTTRIAVPDVLSADCRSAIEAALVRLAGVVHVEVDACGNVVSVEHDPHRHPCGGLFA
jgi:hypothetical protein